MPPPFPGSTAHRTDAPPAAVECRAVDATSRAACLLATDVGSARIVDRLAYPKEQRIGVHQQAWVYERASGAQQHDDRHHPCCAALAADVQALRDKIASQPVIEQAKGLLMGYYGISAEVAFTVLVRWSQQSDRKLRLIAGDLVSAAGRPSEHPYGALGDLLGHHEPDFAGAPGPANSRRRTPRRGPRRDAVRPA